MDYVYYHFKTRDISETWDTAVIEDFLRSTGCFRRIGSHRRIRFSAFRRCA
ncbi:MAG: hypothetical protein IK134_03050 [Oscillospiraceae bacterium]|nr:hypothetical protein [Oscillospiraceae bacterium]